MPPIDHTVIIDTRKTGYPVLFSELPTAGTRRVMGRGVVASVVGFQSASRKDGSETTLIVWQTEDGRTGFSGLRSKSVKWEPQP